MPKSTLFKPRPIALAVAVAMGAGPVSGWAAAGRVQFAWGQVKVEQEGGTSAALKRGDSIDAGDTVVTERGRAQIKFTDGSKVSLQPQTAFKIDQYDYQQGSTDASKERSFMSLFRGGLRAISGAIGRSNRASYRLNTPVGTIGIRGTEYLVLLDDNGAIVTVGDGAVALVNDAGEVVLVNGQTGRIVDKSTLPKLVTGKAVVPPPPKDVSDDSEIGESQQDDDEVQVSVTRDGGVPEDTLGNLITDLPVVPVEKEVPVEEVTPIVIPRLETGSGYTVGYTFSADGDGPFGINDKDVDVTAEFEEGQLVAWGGGEGPSDKGDLVLVGAGSDEFIGWGRWSNPNAAMSNFTVVGVPRYFGDQNESLHYVAGRPTDLAALYSAGQTAASYSVLSFTTPTDDMGNLGSFDGASFAVDIANQRVDGQINASMSGDDYELFIYDLGAAGGVFRDTGLYVESMSSCFSAGCDGNVSGLIAGPNADRAGVVYHIEDNDAFRDIFGAVTFIRDPNGPPVPPPPL